MKILNSIFKKQNKCFTLIEILIVIGVLLILIALSFPSFKFFQKESDLVNSAEEIIDTLRLAQNKTLASEGASQWGVYFETSSQPQRYILFKGKSFISRATSSDEVHLLPDSVEIYDINLGGANEVIFNRIVGTTEQYGSISLRLKNDPSKIRNIYVEPSGLVGLAIPFPVSDQNRLKDSRHVHFDYNRQISTSTEKLILTFTYDDSTTTKEITIADNLKDNQISWEGEVNVGGAIQKLKIHTHRLNDPDLGTQFCIHRDRRYNNKSLKIEISGDPGDLIQYTADGQTSKGNSIYVSEPSWQ